MTKNSTFTELKTIRKGDYKMTLSEEGRLARNAYMREYRKERMTDEQRERERAYQIQWKADNPEKVKQHLVDYWDRKAAKMADSAEK